jgi:hypothetical protein
MVVVTGLVAALVVPWLLHAPGGPGSTLGTTPVAASSPAASPTPLTSLPYESRGPARPLAPPSIVSSPPVTPSPSYSWPPPPLKVALPYGPAPTLPLLINDTHTKTLSLEEGGHSYSLGPSRSYVENVTRTPYGVVFTDDQSVNLVTPARTVVRVVPVGGPATVDVSSDGRYLGWSHVVLIGNVGSSTVGLLDLKTRAVVHKVQLRYQAYARGILDDGRVALNTYRNDRYGAVLLSVSTGAVTVIGD